jgi:hypothetical protein
LYPLVLAQLRNTLLLLAAAVLALLLLAAAALQGAAQGAIAVLFRVNLPVAVHLLKQQQR